jgi:hypothetical protein
MKKCTRVHFLFFGKCISRKMFTLESSQFAAALLPTVQVLDYSGIREATP